MLFIVGYIYIWKGKISHFKHNFGKQLIQLVHFLYMMISYARFPLLKNYSRLETMLDLKPLEHLNFCPMMKFGVNKGKKSCEKIPRRKIEKTP